MNGAMKGNAGMTLLEVTFAAGVLATTLALLFGSVLSIAAVGEINECRQIASIQLASVMEELRQIALNYDALLAYTPPPLEILGRGEVVKVECYDSSGNAVVLPADPESLATALPNPVEIQVTITWVDGRGRLYPETTSAFFGR